MSKLPVYKISIDEEFSDGEDLGWTKTAFTSRPAIIIKGMAFSAEVDYKPMVFADKLKYRIAAPAMIPSTIYRNQDGEEFYVEFTAQEIEKIHQKFMKNFSKNKNLFNLEHNSEETVPAYMLECWLVDNPEQDKSFTTYGIKVPKGSLFMVAQVTDKEYYTKLVENDQVGFSIEGFLGLSLSKMEEKFASSEDNNNNNNLINETMKIEEGTEFQIGDKTYVVTNGVPVEKEVVDSTTTTTESETEMACAPEETKMAADVSGDTVTTDTTTTDTTEVPAETAEPIDSYSKAEVDAKFDEIYKLIGELKADEVTEDVTEVETPEEGTTEVAMSLHQRFAEYVRFAKQK